MITKEPSISSIFDTKACEQRTISQAVAASGHVGIELQQVQQQQAQKIARQGWITWLRCSWVMGSSESARPAASAGCT